MKVNCGRLTPPPLFVAGVQFLGCSEAKYAHSYGCDREKQNVEVGDKRGKKTEVRVVRGRLEVGNLKVHENQILSKMGYF